MTKSVRIENADTSSYKVRVIVQNKNAEGDWVSEDKPHELPYPTGLFSGYITGHRRLIVEEYE